jgi:hypothetical protein
MGTFRVGADMMEFLARHVDLLNGNESSVLEADEPWSSDLMGQNFLQNANMDSSVGVLRVLPSLIALAQGSNGENCKFCRFSQLHYNAYTVEMHLYILSLRVGITF